MEVDPASLPIPSTEDELRSIEVACRAILKRLQQEATKVYRRQASPTNSARIQELWEAYGQSQVSVRKIPSLPIAEARALQAYLAHVLEPQ